MTHVYTYLVIRTSTHGDSTNVQLNNAYVWIAGDCESGLV